MRVECAIDISINRVAPLFFFSIFFLFDFFFNCCAIVLRLDATANSARQGDSDDDDDAGKGITRTMAAQEKVLLSVALGARPAGASAESESQYERALCPSSLPATCCARIDFSPIAEKKQKNKNKISLATGKLANMEHMESLARNVASFFFFWALLL